MGSSRSSSSTSTGSSSSTTVRPWLRRRAAARGGRAPPYGDPARRSGRTHRRRRVPDRRGQPPGRAKRWRSAERTRLSLQIPVRGRGVEIASSVSIGVTCEPTDTDPSLNAEALLRDADTAMYQAKEPARRRGGVRRVDPRPATRRLALEHELHQALERGELHLYYQPIVSSRRGDEGFEALLRWSHPTRGQIPPATFVPLAEDTGLIVPIGAWVIEEARPSSLVAEGAPERAADLNVAVNLSVRQLHDSELFPCVRATLKDEKLPDGSLSGAHREPADGQSAAAAELLETASVGLGVRSLDRRLRHRLLVSSSLPPLPGRPREDRPLLCRRSRRRPSDAWSPRSWRWRRRCG